MSRKDKLFPEELELPHCPKPGALLYVEDWETIRGTTTPEQRARFADAVVDYVHHGVIPDFDTEPILRVCWRFVYPKLVRDQKDYNHTVWKNRYISYKRELKECQEAMSPAEWLQVVTSGYQWPPNGTGTGNEDSSGTGDETGNIPGKGDDAGRGKGNGVRGEGTGEPCAPSFDMEAYERERQSKWNPLNKNG